MKTTIEKILEEQDVSSQYAQLAGFWKANAQMMQEHYEILKAKLEANETIEKVDLIGLNVTSKSIREATLAVNTYKEQQV